MSQSWHVLIFCACLIIAYIVERRRRRRQQQHSVQQVSGSSAVDPADRYEQMERIRQRQQKAYEEENRRRLEAKRAVSDRKDRCAD